MNSTVRLKEIDGQLMLPVPDDIAAHLKMTAGKELSVGISPTGLVAELKDEQKRRQLELAKQIIDEHDEALAALAK